MDKESIVRSIETDFGTVFIILPSALALGKYHDVLMGEKGWAVDKMIAAQKEEEAASAALQEKEEEKDTPTEECEE